MRVAPEDPASPPVFLDLSPDADFYELQRMIQRAFGLKPDFLAAFFVPGAGRIVSNSGPGQLYIYTKVPFDTPVAHARGYRMEYKIGRPASVFEVEFVDDANPLSPRTS